MKGKLESILIVHPHLTIYGGAEILLSHLTEELIKSGIEISLVTLSLNAEVETHFNNRIKFILPQKHLKYKLRSTCFMNALGILPEIWQLKKLIQGELPFIDAINIHNFPTTWAVSKRFNKPVVWTCNEPPALWNNPSPSYILKATRKFGGYIDTWKIRNCIDKVIVSDEVNAARVTNLYRIIPEIINYGIDYDFFAKKVKTDTKKKLSLEESVVLLHVGLFSPQKNQLESVKVLDKLQNIIPHIKLLFAGKGDNAYEKEVRKFVKEHLLVDRVLFLGHVNRERIRELYQIADIALFPTKSQGGWLSPFEAIASSIPVIVSPELTASSLIKSNKLGYVSEEFTSNIIEIIKNLEAEGKKAKIAQQWVRSNLSWEEYSRKMADVFNQVINLKELC